MKLENFKQNKDSYDQGEEKEEQGANFNSQAQTEDDLE
jgi:hypothetical protein